MKRINFFAVNAANMAVVDRMFGRDGFAIPSPRCFGRSVKSFNLDLQVKTAPKFQWRLGLPFTHK